MAKINIEYIFNLQNGMTRAITIKDIRDDIKSDEITALADLLIEKDSQYNGIPMISLKKCTKYTLEEEIIS
ncbi:MAG: DUF2922 domain-containing protein [Oscillospiraceae bacterium]|nr:DUF2922 domain-containing protein [Oscillospiraceae bacterium]